MMSLLTFINSVSDFETTLSASLSNLVTFTGTEVLQAPNIHGMSHKCSSVIVPEVWFSEKESVNIPTTSMVWASTHHYITHGGFSNDYYKCGTSGFGKNMEWSLEWTTSVWACTTRS